MRPADHTQQHAEIRADRAIAFAHARRWIAGTPIALHSVVCSCPRCKEYRHASR